MNYLQISVVVIKHSYWAYDEVAISHCDTSTKTRGFTTATDYGSHKLSHKLSTKVGCH